MIFFGTRYTCVMYGITHCNWYFCGTEISAFFYFSLLKYFFKFQFIEFNFTVFTLPNIQIWYWYSDYYFGFLVAHTEKEKFRSKSDMYVKLSTVNLFTVTRDTHGSRSDAQHDRRWCVRQSHSHSLIPNSVRRHQASARCETALAPLSPWFSLT